MRHDDRNQRDIKSTEPEKQIKTSKYALKKRAFHTNNCSETKITNFKV